MREYVHLKILWNLRIINVLLLLLLVIYKQVPVLIKKKVLLSRVDWDTDLNERFFFFPKGL